MIPIEVLPGVLGGRWLSPGVGTLRGASIDTRTLAVGQAFFAMSGARVDGHAFLDRAADAGAGVAIVEREVTPPEGLAVLLVSSTRTALWNLAEWYRARLTARVIAVMGSNGKTTTVRMMASVLNQSMHAHASARSFNNALGLPLTLLNCSSEAEALVCELGEGEPGALARYTGLAKPDMAVVTSVGRAHVGELGGMEAVQREFSDALAAMASHAEAFVPDELAWLHAPCRTTFGITRAWHADGRTHLELADGSTWSVPVVGLHNASNASAVIAVARGLGVPDARIAAGLDAFEPAEMRLAVREIGGATVLVDCYNANPDSMAAALHTLAGVGKESHKAAIIGDMLDLGSDSLAWHREIGTLAAACADTCIFVGPSARAAFEAAGTGVWFATVAEAARAAGQQARPGSVLLLKASRGMKLESLLEAMQQAAVA